MAPLNHRSSGARAARPRQEVLDVVSSSVFSLWQAVNALTRLRPRSVALPRDDLRIRAGAAGSLGLQGSPRSGGRADAARLRHRHGRRPWPDAGGQPGRARRESRRRAGVNRHSRRSAVRAGRQRVRDRGIRARHVLHPCTTSCSCRTRSSWQAASARCSK
jgi:hypothetical protein